MLLSWKAVLRFEEALKTVLPPEHIALKRPYTKDDLPVIVLSAKDMRELPLGIGRVLENERISDKQWKESVGAKVAGDLSLEIWAANGAEVRTIAETVFQLINNFQKHLYNIGFVKICAAKISPIETIEISDGTPAVIVIIFSIVFEEINTTTVGPGGIIKQVQATFNDPVNGMAEETEIP